MANGNNLFTLGLNVSATKAQMDKQLKQIVSELSNQKTVQVTGGLNISQTQSQMQKQLDTISRNLKVNIQIDTNAVNQQMKGLQNTIQGSTKGVGAVKVPFQFDLSDAKAVKAEINKIVSDITNNQGQLVKYKINVDENGQATKALLTYRNELNEVTNATLKLKTVGTWYDGNNVKHNFASWAEGQKILSQNIEATTNANKKQIDSDNQVIRKKAELIAQMNLLNTQAQKSGVSLNADNQSKFNNLAINPTTLEDIKQLESYLRLARTEYQTFNAEIAKGTHASSLETMKNTLLSMPNDIALIEARFNSIKMPDSVRVQIEQLKADMEGINSITDPQAKIQKYNEMIASLQNLQKQFQVTNQEQKNVNAGFATMQGASTLSNNIIAWMAQNTNAATQYDMELKQIIVDLQSVSNKTDLTRLQQQFRNIQSQVQATNNVSQGFFGGLRTQLTDALTVMFKYQMAYKIINKTIQAIKSLINAVNELDANLTEFNKVADISTKEIEKFADKAFLAAEKIGRTGSDMIEAATEFKRAGYTLEESLSMGSAALVMTNVAEGIDTTADSASTLISVLKGFDIDDTDIMSIVDKINNVSNKSPVGFDNLAEGLERVSGTMSQAGNSINETIGLLTGGFTQLRNMEKVSTGLITISQRLRAVDEDGESIDGLSAELEKSFGSIGVSIEDANGDLRSTYDIISDYAKVFPTLTSEQKQYFGEVSAGKRQISVWNAIVQEINGVNTAIEQSVDSVGAAETENEIYRQSIQGLKNEWDNAVEKFATETFSSDWIKDFISAGTDLVKVFTNIVQQDDLASGTIGVVADGFKGLASVLKELTESDFIGGIIKGILTLKTITMGVKLFDYLKVKAATQSGIGLLFRNTTSGVRSLNGELVATQEASAGAATGMKALSLATNLGVMLAVTATIQALKMGYDKLNDTIEENQQRIDDINSSLTTLNDEYTTLLEKSKNDGLTQEEKDRLDYLERRVSIENELLKIEQKKLAKNTIGTSWTDAFDSQSMSSKQSKAENDNTLSSNRDEATYAIGYINNIQDRIAEAEQEKANAISTGLKEIYQDRIDELTSEETKYLDSLSEKYDTFYEKKAEYEENAMQIQSVIDDGLLSGDDLETAKQRLSFFQSEIDSLEYLLDKTDLLTGNFDFDLDGLAEKLSNISSEDLLSNFSNEEIKVLVGLDFDKDASLEDLKQVLEDAQGLADDTNIKLEPLSTSEIISSIAGIKEGFSSLGNVFNDFKENGIVTADTLSGLNETFGKVSGYKDFINVLGDSNSTLPQVENAVSSLASEYLLSQNVLKNCTEADKGLMISQLKSIGVMNAEEVVTGALTQRTEELAAEKIAASAPDFANMTAEEIAQLATHSGASEHAAQMLNYLAIQKTLQENDGFANLTMNETNRLLDLANAANMSADSIKTLSSALTYKKGIEEANSNANMKVMEYYERKINELDTGKITAPVLTLPKVNYVSGVQFRHHHLPQKLRLLHRVHRLHKKKLKLIKLKLILYKVWKMLMTL
jgi:phage tail tape measure protein, TP901 family, core region